MFAGWWLVGWAALVLGALCAGILAAHDGREAGLHAVVVAMSRTSLLLFLLVFLTSSLRTLRKNDATRWLLKNRRYLGNSFAVSHGMHLLAVLAYQEYSAARAPTAVVILGGLGYLLIAAMVATVAEAASFQRSLDGRGMNRTPPIMSDNIRLQVTSPTGPHGPCGVVLEVYAPIKDRPGSPGIPRLTRLRVFAD